MIFSGTTPSCTRRCTKLTLAWQWSWVKRYSKKLILLLCCIKFVPNVCLKTLLFQIARRSSSAKTSRSAQRVEQALLDRFVTSLDSSPRQNSSVLAGWKFWHLQMLKIWVAQFMSQEMLECFTCCTLKTIKSSWPGQYLWAKKEKCCGWGKGASTGALPTGRNRCSSFFEVRSHSVCARI